MFSVEWLDDNQDDDDAAAYRTPDDHAWGSIYYTKETGRKTRLCTIVDWGFNSCACYHLQKFGDFTGIDTERFWLFVGNIYKTWKPTEAYFMLSGYQLESDDTAQLIKSEYVKEIDKFQNKSHASSGVRLFRFSLEKDFPCVT